MTATWQERSAEFQRDLARHDAEWAETKRQLREVGDCELPIPVHALEALEIAVPAPLAITPRGYLVRG